MFLHVRLPIGGIQAQALEFPHSSLVAGRTHERIHRDQDLIMRRFGDCGVKIVAMTLEIFDVLCRNHALFDPRNTLEIGVCRRQVLRFWQVPALAQGALP